jgi:hypothetical protein
MGGVDPYVGAGATDFGLSGGAEGVAAAAVMNVEIALERLVWVDPMVESIEDVSPEVASALSGLEAAPDAGMGAIDQVFGPSLEGLETGEQWLDSGAGRAAPPEKPSPAEPEELPPPIPDDELFPWELPPSSATATAAESRAPDIPAPPFSYEDAVPPSVPALADEPHDGGGLDTPVTPSTDPAPAQQADDDLESFQAWLRSLKR